jgi:alpha-beta hydrolase superfamily lysophospholipase
MKTFSSGWQGADGTQFYLHGWEPDKKPKAIVALVHGIGEHSGRYAHVGEAFAKAGYALVGFDLRGHGKSGGPRGHIPSYDTMMNDIADFLDLLEKRYRKLPTFLYGHSLGGNQVINFSLRRKPKLKGVIATSPWLKLPFQPPAVQITLGKVMNRIAPGFTQSSKLDTAALSRDPEVARTYERDPLVHDKVSARLFVDFGNAGLWALEHAAEFPLPLLLMHGTADRLTSAEASREFAERGGKHITWRQWKGFYHEIHNEPEKAEVLKVMIGWMNARLKKK